MINRSLCYDSHNSSINHHPTNNVLNQSFEYPSQIAINANNSYIYVPAPIGKSMEPKKIHQQ